MAKQTKILPAIDRKIRIAKKAPKQREQQHDITFYKKYKTLNKVNKKSIIKKL